MSERKFVTVLVVDMVGSLSAIQDADPEEAHDLFSFGIGVMTESIHDYGGTIFANTGDGVLAMFGAPEAQSDHPVRSCHAALKVLQRLTEARKTKDLLDVRIGIHSGEVAFGMSRTDLSANYDVTGATVHIASRLQSYAPNGGAVMSEASHVLIGDAFETEPMGPAEIRGLSKRVGIFRLGKPRGAGRIESNTFESIFVGRAAETAALETALERADEGSGSAVMIEGEPGIGKTHLIDRFVQDLPASIGVSRITVDRYHDNAPFRAIRSILLGLFDQTETTPEQRQAKILEISQAAGVEKETTAAALSELLDLDYGSAWRSQDARTRNRQLSHVVVDQVIRRAKERTYVVVVEDLQWIDSCSLDVIGRLIAAAANAPLLLILTCRSGAELKWRDAPALLHLQLSGLANDDIDHLVDHIMGTTATPAFRKQLLEWSRGNPLFLCEVVRTLVESEDYRASPRARTLEQTRFVPPETVRGIVAERIDRLPTGLKDILLAASVLGDNFEPELLGTIVGKSRHKVLLSLKRLEGLEFLREISGQARPGFAFRHPLFQEVSYATVLKKTRTRLHALAYQELSARHEGDGEVSVEHLAYHAFNGALWDHAAKNCHGAGRKALDRLAAREAAQQLQNAITAIEQLEQHESNLARGLQIRLELRTALIQLLHLSQAEDLVSEAHAIAVRLEDSTRLAEVIGLKALHEYLQRGPSSAKELSEKSIALARPLEDRMAVVAPSICLAQTHYALGQFDSTISIVQDILPTISNDDRSNRLGLPADALIVAWYWIAISNSELGKFDEAQSYIEKMQAHRLENNALNQVFTDTALGFVLMTKGDYVPACEASLKAWGLAESSDFPYLTPVLASQAGWLLAKTGNTSRAVQLGRRAVETALEIGVFAGRSRWCARLADICLIAGLTDEARRNVKIAIDVASNAGELSYLASGLQLRARLSSEFDGVPSKAHNDLRRVLAIAHRLKTYPAYTRCLFDLARLERGRGNLASAERKFVNAERRFRRMGMTRWADVVTFEQSKTARRAVSRKARHASAKNPRYAI